MNYYVVRRNLTREERKRQNRISRFLAGLGAMLLLLLVAGVTFRLTHAELDAQQAKPNVTTVASYATRANTAQTTAISSTQIAGNG